MREIELKSVVDNLEMRREIVERAGAEAQFAGKLIDARYGDQDGRLMWCTPITGIPRAKASDFA